MTDSAENLSNAVQSATNTKAAVAATTISGGVIVSGHDPQVFGMWLAHHGIGALSWVEVFQIIGTIYVFAQLIKMIVSAIQNIRS